MAKITFPQKSGHVDPKITFPQESEAIVETEHPTKLYVGEWSFTMAATSPLKAAKMAEQEQEDPHSGYNGYWVTCDEEQKTWHVDAKTEEMMEVEYRSRDKR